MNARDIVISEHICCRYIERFNQNLASISDYNTRLIAAKRAINTILKDAQYVSDDHRGILLYSKMYKANIIVHNRVLITIYSPDEKQNKKRKN